MVPRNSTCHDTSTLLCANWCPRPSSVVSIYIKRGVICSCSAGPFGPPEEKKGVQHFFSSNFFSSKIRLLDCFSRAALILFVFLDRSAPIHVQNIYIPFGPFQSSLEGGVKTRLNFLIPLSFPELSQKILRNFPGNSQAAGFD